MIYKFSQKYTLFTHHLRYRFSQSSQGSDFLHMVEAFFDKAAIHTGIRADRLNFYKKAESVVKCSIPLVRGITRLCR